MRFVLLLLTVALLLTKTVSAIDGLLGKSSPRQIEMLHRMSEKNRQKVENVDKHPCYGGLNNNNKCFEETQLYQALYNLIGNGVPALGFVLTAFLPPTSPEFKELVKSFEIVNKKLDVIGDKVNDILRMLPLTQKSAYIKSLSDIDASHEKLMDFYKELSSADCKPNITSTIKHCW